MKYLLLVLIILGCSQPEGSLPVPENPFIGRWQGINSNNAHLELEFMEDDSMTIYNNARGVKWGGHYWIDNGLCIEEPTCMKDDTTYNVGRYGYQFQNDDMFLWAYDEKFCEERRYYINGRWLYQPKYIGIRD